MGGKATVAPSSHVQHNPFNTDTFKSKETISYQTKPEEATSGIIKTRDYQVDPQVLKLQRYGRIGATTGAVVLNLWSVFSLFKAAYKLVLSTLGHGDKDEAFETLGKAYTKSSIAGGLTGVANESSYWAIGNLGMGLFSYLGLDKVHNLAGFSIADGLASIGMGQVRYRDSQNAFAVQHSIFNNPKLSFLSGLMPAEQGILNFGKKVATLNWKRFVKDEPYSLFQASGGGLIAAGGALAITSLFANRLSEEEKSVSYIPYSLLSALNLIALFRDGSTVLERANDFGGRKQSEDYSMRLEGYFKQIAAPVLGINNLLLGLKGFGFDSSSGILFPLAMSARAIGASVAFLGFTAQSALRFFKPDLFGPYFKRIVEITLNPKEAWQSIVEFIADKRPKVHESDKFGPILKSDENHELFEKIIATPTFQALQHKSQAGLPSPLAPDRAILERFTHSKRVAALAILAIDIAIQKAGREKNYALRDYLMKIKPKFVSSGLMHDIGHVARSHLAEKAVKGFNNDEETIRILKDKNSDIYKEIANYFIESKGKEAGKKYAEEFIAEVRKIIGHKSPLSKLLKLCDFLEYTTSNGGDFNSANPEEFPAWSIKDYERFFENLIFTLDSDGQIQQSFNEKGAIDAFKLLDSRYRFNLEYNYEPSINAREIAYMLGIDAEDPSLEEVRNCTEEKFDEIAKRGIQNLNGNHYKFKIRTTFGGETAYCGYSSSDPRRRITVNGEEFLSYRDRVLRLSNKSQYVRTQEMVDKLTTPVEIELRIKVANQENNPWFHN